MKKKDFKYIIGVLIICCFSFNNIKHPIFISVTELDYNNKNKSIEINCKIFTDDFEKTLRKSTSNKINLTDAQLKTSMDKLVSEYIYKNFQIAINNKATIPKYVGFEQIEEATYCYFEIENIIAIKSITITNSILYDYKKEQTNLIHIYYQNNTKSIKLINPQKIFTTTFN